MVVSSGCPVSGTFGLPNKQRQLAATFLTVRLLQSPVLPHLGQHGSLWRQVGIPSCTLVPGASSGTDSWAARPLGMCCCHGRPQCPSLTDAVLTRGSAASSLLLLSPMLRVDLGPASAQSFKAIGSASCLFLKISISSLTWCLCLSTTLFF